MARASLTSGTQKFIEDPDSILFNIVQGEQLVFPVQLDFLKDAAGLEFEAVVVEALNEPGQTSVPKAIKPSGKQDTLQVFQPVFKGEWQASTAYNTNELVTHSGNVYRLKMGLSRVSVTPPEADEQWEETSMNIVYVCFPKTLSLNWEQQPTVESSVYGYFELRVSEHRSHVFPQTWKPIRGPVEIAFSPTEIVP